MKQTDVKVTLQPLWTSYIQSLKAGSGLLGLNHSTAYIFGATGHAFIINIHPELCPSGPTCFSTAGMDKLAENLGIGISPEMFCPAEEEFSQRQNEVLNKIKAALDKGLPLIGWDLKVPEYYLILGYDKDRLLFLDLEGKPQSCLQSALGKGETQVGKVSFLSPLQKTGDATKTLKDAFTFTLEFAQAGRQWVFPGYYTGKKAYSVWMDALQKGKADPMGLAYNAQVWSECRTYAVEFLKEAKSRLKTRLLDNLIEHYDVVAWSLQKVAKLFPMGIKEIDPDAVDTAADTLYLAQEAEKTALAEMRSVLSQL